MNNSIKAVLIMSITILLIGLIAILAWFYVNNRNIEIKENQQNANSSNNSIPPINNSSETNANAGLQNCLDEAEKSYWSFVKLNADSSRETEEGIVYSAKQNVWDSASSNKEEAENSCYRKKETGVFDNYNSTESLRVSP